MSSDDQNTLKFINFLRRLKPEERKATVRNFIARSGVDISEARAWRICSRLKIKGHRRNHTGLAPFWDELDWGLPDTALARIWSLDRSNLGKRRRRLQRPAAKWRLPRDTRDDEYRRAFRAQDYLARKFQGRVPDPRQPRRS